MTMFNAAGTGLSEDVCVRALRARDARFDGVFFVGITSTSIYCRPVCPARVSRPDHRRFFGTAAAAERAGFRPCRRCRPELAPGRALIDSVSRLAAIAMRRIEAGALNGHSVRELASALCVSDRHLRRALDREIGASPVELAQTHRLLLAKRLLTDTALPIGRVAYTSGFQSLRRFNVAFRERYGMAPSTLRRRRPGPLTPKAGTDDAIRLTLAYRTPYAWDAMIALLARERVNGIEHIDGRRLARTVCIDGHHGVVVIDATGTEHHPRDTNGGALAVDVSPPLLPVLMPLLARLRHLLDLDAEPTVVDACLARNGLDRLVRARPGLRIAGAVDGFDTGLRMLLRRAGCATATDKDIGVVMRALGEPVQTAIDGLTHLAPTAVRVASAGASALEQLGVPRHCALTVHAFALAVAGGRLRLEPGSDPDSTCAALAALPGVEPATAAAIAARTLGWPDTFYADDAGLQRAAGTADANALLERAEAWRPWRAYAAAHLQAAG